MEALIVVASYGVAIWLANRIADDKGRKNGWVWGLLLGWIGVLICALRGSVEGKETEQLELQVKRYELEQRRNQFDAARKAEAARWQAQQVG